MGMRRRNQRLKDDAHRSTIDAFCFLTLPGGSDPTDQRESLRQPDARLAVRSH
jgi:hypothetical protein